ncbi:unnamed protein product [Lathyrus sativus]|nr:unnamed protein product [Lathyrus sativus]
MMQKAKVTWLQMGDNNNAYFLASVKGKNKQKGLYNMVSLNGELLSNQEDIEKKIVDFYSKLVGTNSSNLKGIDVPTVIKGKTLPKEDAQQLISPVDDNEIWKALTSI